MMYVFRLSDWRFVIVLSVVVAAVLGLLIFHPVRVESYTAEDLVLLSWGEDSGQCGKTVGLDGLEYGPRSFAVDTDGYMYIGDTFNHRVLVISPAGVPVAEFNFAPEAVGGEPLIQDIAVDRQRDIYIADFGGTGVYRYDHIGNLLQTWPLNQEAASAAAGSEATDLWVTDRIEVHGPGQVTIARTRISAEEYRRDVARIDLLAEKTWSLASTSVSESTVGNWDAVQEPGQFCTFTASRTGMLVTERPASPFERTVSAWAGADEPEWQTVVHSKQYIDEAALIGIDGRGRVYLGINLNQPGGAIYRLDARGVNYTLPVGAEPEARAHVYARVTGNGDIYTMCPTAEGVKLSVMRYSTRWSLAPRW